MPWSQLLQILIAGAALSIGLMSFNPLLRDHLAVIARYSHPAFVPVIPYIFPAGGRTLFPGYRLIALYGSPDFPPLGSLGQQPLPATINRAKTLAEQYQPLFSEHALPTLEIIATVASAAPTPNGSYSEFISTSELNTWVTAAQKSDVYTVLDLQPGRDNFLSQAQQYKSILEQPYVGLALDPEWRLTPTQLPLQQIGSVSIAEVNQTAQWLADLTKQYNLPQKLFLLHEFRLTMLPDRNQLDTSYPQLAYVIQMDGQGTQPNKLTTWNNVIANPPPNVSFGWKNFYLKDSPLRTPQQTMQLMPQPRYVSYQ
jgi:hypothetical protein